MSDFGFLGAFAGKVTGKVMNATNSSQELMCLGKCDKITKHINISYADVELANGIAEAFDSLAEACDDSSLKLLGKAMDTLGSISGTARDYMPLTPLALHRLHRQSMTAVHPHKQSQLQWLHRLRISG